MRIAIVEDDSEFAKGLHRFIDDYGKELGAGIPVDEYANGLEFIFAFSSQYDVVFMDVDMPHIDGIDTAKKMRETDENVTLVYITNMVRSAIRGYDVGAFDFLIKPIEYSDLKRVMDKITRNRMRKKHEDLYFMSDSTVRRIDVSDITYIDVYVHTVTVHTTSGDHSKRGSLKEFEGKLDDVRFLRVNRCYIINLAHVTEVGKDTVTVGKDTLYIGNDKKRMLLDALAKYIGKYGGV